VVVFYKMPDGDDGSDSLLTAVQPSSPPRVYRVSRASFERRDGIFHPPIIVPPGWYPLPEARLDVVLRDRSLGDNGVGGGVLSYPRIPQYF
jgi:hypothetical protein